jgi:CRISPR-associated exonuclease Cas4
MGQQEVSITISDVLEYLFCPRFIYFMYCLDIPQHEGKRFKVQKGREVHEIRRKTNQNYLRKKFGCIRKESSVYLSSPENHIRGIVDEILFLEDGTAAPFEYKFAEYKGKIFRTYRYQLVLHALMIRDTYGVGVEKGFICYTRSNSRIEELRFKEKDFEEARHIINDILEIIQKGHFPKVTGHKNKCIDCCYRNICA